MQTNHKIKPTHLRKKSNTVNQKHSFSPFFMHVFMAGTFDLFHVGHQWFLWSGIKHATQVTIIIAQDATVQAIKGFTPCHTQTQRLQRVQQEFTDCPHVTVTIGAPKSSMLTTLQNAAPNCIFLGYDQHAPTQKIKEILPDITIKRCPHYAPHLFKSSHFR